MDEQDARAKVTELIRDGRICMFATVAPDGRFVSRPMGLQQVEFDGDMWFFAYEDSPKVHEIAVDPRVNVSFNTKKDAWVSVAGTAEVVHDRAKAEELWNPFVKAWFPDGLDTPGLTLLRVRAESAEYWDAPHGRVVTLIEYAAAAVLGKQPPEGENEVVELNPLAQGAE